MIAEGWDIEDTTGKGTRGSLPAEAVEVECIVGSLDYERASGTTMTAEEFNDYAATYAVSSERRAPRLLTDEELSRVRVRRGELFAQWSALPPGAAIELHFEASC